MLSNGFPNVTTLGQQYNIGEKPSVILYTHLHESPCRDTKTTILFICLGVPDSYSSINVVLYMVSEKLNKLY